MPVLGLLGARLLRPFDLNVIAYDPFASPESAAALGATLCSLGECFARAEVVSLHTPWLPETERMVTGEHFASMKKGATFINTFDGNVSTGAGATPTFVNAGVFAKTNGTAALGATSIDFQFINTGTVEVRTNSLRYLINQQTAGLTLLDGGGLLARMLTPCAMISGCARSAATPSSTAASRFRPR